MVLNALGNWGYRVSFSEAQIASTTVNYLGLLLIPTSKIIPPQRRRALTQTLRPQTKRELLYLLGLLNFFQIWVPNFSLHAKPLYQATRGNLDEPLLAPTSLHAPIQTLTKHLLQAPSLYLADNAKPFFLFVHSRQEHALRILCQKKGVLMGASSLLIQTTQSCHAQTATLSPGLSCNYPLNTWSPKTNPKCSFKYMLTSFLQRFTLSSGFPFSTPCSTTDPPPTPPRPIPFCYAL